MELDILSREVGTADRYYKALEATRISLYITYLQKCMVGHFLNYAESFYIGLLRK